MSANIFFIFIDAFFEKFPNILNKLLLTFLIHQNRKIEIKLIFKCQGYATHYNQDPNKYLRKNKKSKRSPTTHLSVNDTHPSASSLILCKTLLTIIGRNTFSCRWPWHPPKVTAVWLPITCAAIIVSDSHCVGFTFPVRQYKHSDIHEQ